VYRPGQEVSVMVHPRIYRSPLRVAGFVNLLFLMVCAAGPSLAESTGHREEVWREIEKTQVVIDKARELTSEATAVASLEHLRTAIDAQRKAVEHHRRERYAQAAQLTLFARGEALKALDLARAEKKTQESVVRIIDRAEELAADIGPLAHESGNPQAVQIFDQGLDHLRRARLANRDRHYAQATRLAQLATELIERARTLARAGLQTGAAAETEIERASALLAQVLETLQERAVDPGEYPLLQELRDLIGRARIHLRDGQVAPALRLGHTAREKAMQLLSALDRLPDLGNVAETLEELTALYAELGPQIEAEGGEREQRMLEEGRNLLHRARKLLRQEKSREALRHLLAAERLLKEAARAAGV